MSCSPLHPRPSRDGSAPNLQYQRKCSLCLPCMLRHMRSCGHRQCWPGGCLRGRVPRPRCRLPTWIYLWGISGRCTACFPRPRYKPRASSFQCQTAKLCSGKTQMRLRNLSRLQPTKKKIFLLNIPWPEMSFALLPHFFF